MCARQFDAQLAEQAEALLPVCWRMRTTCLQLTVTNTRVAMSAGTHLLFECIVPHQQNISLIVLWKICSVYVHSPTVISADDLLRGCQQISQLFLPSNCCRQSDTNQGSHPSCIKLGLCKCRGSKQQQGSPPYPHPIQVCASPSSTGAA